MQVKPLYYCVRWNNTVTKLYVWFVVTCSIGGIFGTYIRMNGSYSMHHLIVIVNHHLIARTMHLLMVSTSTLLKMYTKNVYMLQICIHLQTKNTSYTRYLHNEKCISQTAILANTSKHHCLTSYKGMTFVSLQTFS